MVFDDSNLWDDFRKNKEYALSYIYHHHIAHLYSYGKKFTSDTDLIKDSIQELFVYLIRNREHLGSTDNIRFYLMSALKHRIIRSMHEQKRFIENEKLDGQYELLITFSFEEEIIDKENLSQKELLIKNALNKISPKQREILYYRYTCDFDYDRICEIMSIKYDSARKMVFRALKLLREQMEDTEVLLFILFKKEEVIFY